MIKKLLAVAVLALCLMPVSAQKFILDPILEDSVECYAASKKDTVWRTAEPFKAVKFAKGTEIESCGPADGAYIAFKDNDGKHYVVHEQHLKFSDDNPDDAINPLDEENIRKHGAVGHFYATSVPAEIVVILIAVILVVFFLALKIDSFVKIAIVTIPAALLAVSIIEIEGVLTLGGDAFWWCDSDKYGFFGAFFRVIPFILVVAAQYYSFKMFEAVLFSGPEDEGKSLSIKPAAISIAICIPVVLAYFFIVQQIIGWKGDASDIVMKILFAVTLLTGIAISLLENIATMGTLKGIAVSLFGIIYIIGLISALIGVITVLIELFVQVALLIGALIMIDWMGSSKTYRGSDGHRYQKSNAGTTYRRID